MLMGWGVDSHGWLLPLVLSTLSTACAAFAVGLVVPRLTSSWGGVGALWGGPLFLKEGRLLAFGRWRGAASQVKG